MSVAEATKSMTLSVRLLRQNRAVENALREDHERNEVDAEVGRLFVGQAPSTPPTWAPFIGEFARAAVPRLSNRSCGAVGPGRRPLIRIRFDQRPVTGSRRDSADRFTGYRTSSLGRSPGHASATRSHF